MPRAPIPTDGSPTQVLSWALTEPGVTARAMPDGLILLAPEPALATQAATVSEATRLLGLLDAWLDPAMQAGTESWQPAWTVFASYELVDALEPGLPPPPANGPALPLLHVQRNDWWVELAADGSMHVVASTDAAATQRAEIVARRLRLAATRAPLEPPDVQEVHATWSRGDYMAAFARVRNHIHEGDFYVTNLTQAFHAPESPALASVWPALLKASPAPLAAALSLGGGNAIASASPERFVRVFRDGSSRTIETCPIKGTRPHLSDPAADAAERSELTASPKERAELTMVVDLERNDLSRVSVPGTVKVPEHCRLDTFRQVHHLSSRVTGQLQAGARFTDILRAVFPGGSVTGTPKLSAIANMRRIEPVARGPYTGSLFWLGGFAGECLLDSSILIRTVLLEPDGLWFNAGGGIVYESDPDMEYEECFHKARGLLEALGVTKITGT